MKYIELPLDKIKLLYLDKKVSISKIAKLYKVSNWVISERIKSLNIEKYNQGFFLRDTKNIDEYYFDNIDTEEKAYFLGLLYADGCNHRGKSLRLALNYKNKIVIF